MRKLFTLVALLACFLGAKAVEITDFTVDYTQKGKSTIGWKADMIQDEWITADEDGLHLYNPEVTENFYDYQLWIFSGANLEVDMDYTIKIVAKVSDGSADVRCRIGDWGGGISSTVTVNSTDYQEYTYSGKATTASNGLLVQFGDYVGTVSFKSVTITHEGKEEKPVEWIEVLTNGDASKTWAEMGLADVRFDDQENNYKVCAWGKEKGVNMNDNGGWDPFPATIETVDGKNVFVVHGKLADTEGDPSAWDNQFWIQSTRAWKAGEQVKIHFLYKASAPVSSTDTQIHKQNPSDYLIWHAIGNIEFKTDWQEFDGVMDFADDMNGGWSIAFNLNTVVKDPVDFYFADLSWQEMKLEHGLFVAAANTTTGVEYDYDNPIEFVYDADLDAYVATVGTKGKEDTWVNELMISTVKGNDKAFRSGTLKPSGDFVGEDAWGNYTEASGAKIKPGNGAAGVWTIAIDTEQKQMNIIQIDGELPPEPIEINPNPTVVVVHGLEREPTSGEQPADEEAGIAAGTGQPWDNQFFLVANRNLEKGEETVVAFSYRASKEAKTTTQLHGEPGAYMHWAAIGDVNFTTEWQDFSTDLIIPSEADGMKSIAFNMAEIKEACDYEIKDIIWKVKGDFESLIDQTGTKNFYVKEGAGTAPYEFGTDPSGIKNVTNNTKNSSAAIYNIAGQRVSKDYKGIVVKSGKKYVVK